MSRLRMVSTHDQISVSQHSLVSRRTLEVPDATYEPKMTAALLRDYLQAPAFQWWMVLSLDPKLKVSDLIVTEIGRWYPRLDAHLMLQYAVLGLCDRVVLARNVRQAYQLQLTGRDVQTIQQVSTLSNAARITLVDYLVVGNHDGHTSAREMGIL